MVNICAHAIACRCSRAFRQDSQLSAGAQPLARVGDPRHQQRAPLLSTTLELVLVDTTCRQSCAGCVCQWLSVGGSPRPRVFADDVAVTAHGGGRASVLRLVEGRRGRWLACLLGGWFRLLVQRERHRRRRVSRFGMRVISLLCGSASSGRGQVACARVSCVASAISGRHECRERGVPLQLHRKRN